MKLPYLLLFWLLSVPITRTFAQPHAEFLMSAGEGCVNDVVSFINLSFGGVVSHDWDFGDGSTSDLVSPTHVFSDTGTYTVTLTATDGDGLTDTWTEDYIVRPPVVDFVLTPPIGCAIPHTVFFTDLSTLPDTWFWDFGDGNTSTLQNPVHNYTTEGTFVVTFTITDTIYGCSDISTDTVKISIPTAAVDDGLGHFGCGPLSVDFEESSVPGAFGSLTSWAWDFGDGTTSAEMEPSHTYEDPGVYTVSLTVTNSLGCTSTDHNPFLVQVIGPNVNFGADTVFTECPPLTVNFTDSTIFGAPIVSWNWNFGDGGTSGLQNPTHTYTDYGNYDVSLTVTDIDGCSRTLTFPEHIKISDTLTPSLTCPPDQTVELSALCNYTLPDFTGLVTATDNCTDPLVLTQSVAAGTVITENTLIEISTTDNALNDSTCSFNVFLIDNSAPVITCPPDADVSFDATCAYTLPDYTGLATATDNCTSPDITQFPLAGTAITGTETITLTTVDTAGNTTSCTFDVIPVDDTTPTITCPADVTVNNDPGVCGATLTYTTPVGLDNCTPTTALTTGLASGSLFPIGTTTNTYTVTDGAGLSATCSFDITVIDAENPTITCPADISVNNDPGECGATITYGTPVGVDNCTSTTDHTAGLASGSLFPLGTTTNTYEVTDAAGLTATCSFDVVVIDNENPTITCPGDLTLDATAGICSANVTFADPVITDNCAGTTVDQTGGLVSGSDFPIGTTTNSYEVTDASGNTTTCSFDITVIDAELPSITCPGDIATCESIIDYDEPTYADNCGIADFNMAEGLPSGSEFPVGTTTVEYIVTDPSGNENSCTFEVTRFPIPAIIAQEEHTLDAGDSALLEVTAPLAETFSWSPTNGLDDPTIDAPKASPFMTTTYTVTVVTPEGCQNEKDITVNINEVILVTNFMSPNADGKNDNWLIKGNFLLDQCTVQIYDSWGNLVRESQGYANDWDGRNADGRDLPEGNYYYVISCPGDEPLTGSITLIR